jgi:hypothetical protein
MYSLDSVAQLLSKKLTYLNLKGLAKLKNLGVRIKSEKSEVEENVINHDFIITYVKKRIDGNITLMENPKTNEVSVANIFPNLPSDRDFGVTMFKLILVRGNILAGRKIEICAPNIDARPMIFGKMKEFSPKLEPLKPGEAELKRIISMIVPRLTQKQVCAAEGFWRNVLHCPANLKLNRKEARRRS